VTFTVAVAATTIGQTLAEKERAMATISQSETQPTYELWTYSSAAAPVPAPAAETVYEEGTVFDEAAFVPKVTSNSVAVNATRARAQRGSLRFFIVAGVSLLEAGAFASADMTALAVAAGVVAAFFGVLGIFAYRMHKSAFLIGALVYAAQTGYLLLHWKPVMVAALAIHGLIIYRLYAMYVAIREVETA
jgi:hypothetical protein